MRVIREYINNNQFWLGLFASLIIGALCLLVDSNDKKDWIGFWGNIVGGLLGTAGAFGAAFWTLRTEDRKRTLSRQRALTETTLKIRNMFLEAQDKVVQEENLDAMISTVRNELIIPLENLLPYSIEFAPSLYEGIARTSKQLRKSTRSAEDAENALVGKTIILGSLLMYSTLFFMMNESVDRENIENIKQTKLYE